ncbi:fimbria/pilus periplasmic chaperone [Shimwellia pseudoproteus]|uniref:fimbria/pilus periplasmic chaperone n=1 Tax=Shimwellia pseudoproteus TaxID=570012 RepID=UPI0018EC1F7D|nr:fimbria/pilus periplasmic chaperone [Shimwellia pseudoproteus]MBJ3817073.1 fimbria/pilus periplasmic chaperone [Shimwellia pseudoproteus]
MALLFITPWLAISGAQAGGIALGATRVVYPAEAKQVSLAITNSDKNLRFLIQSWVEKTDGVKSDDFVLTPPLFVSKPAGENTLRIIYAGKPLPKDRESIYWINVKAIPAIDRNAIQGKNVLQLAVLSRIKLFVRPPGLTPSPAEAPAKLTFSKGNGQLIINNPTPYYITLVSFNIGQKGLPNTMVPPMGRAEVAIPGGSGTAITYQTINDYGANTPVIHGVIK